MERKPRYQTLGPQKRTRYQSNEKKRIVRERGYLNLVLNHEEVAEFSLPAPGMQALVSGRRRAQEHQQNEGRERSLPRDPYLFYVTTRSDLSTAEVVRCANERCDQENVIEQLKNGVNALRVPLYDLVSNCAYMVIAALAWNIKSWVALMMQRKEDRSRYVRMEFRRFLHSII